MKCEMCFPLECHQGAKVRTAVVKRVGAKVSLALVPRDPTRGVGGEALPRGGTFGQKKE